MTSEQLNVDWHEYKLTEGSVFVRLHAAEITTKGDWGEPKTEAFNHRLGISTTPSTRHDAERRFLKIRGRKYSIDFTTHKRVREYETRNGVVRRWALDYIAYSGAYLNEKGVAMDYSTAAHARLDEIVHEVLDLFEVDNPDWTKTSERLALEHERARWTSRSAQARSEVSKADAKIAELAERIAAYTTV
ncbi:hypothetical protein ACZ90_00395 [Streptomyces albus subsp. albus]|nr:hypothetical protein ACZ90_00395 [Streptomyces albus subsp. albus]